MKEAHKVVVFFVCVIIAFICGTSLVFAQQAVDSTTDIVKYVGADQCKKCHGQEYSDQIESRYYKSWKILKMRDEQDNPECFKCHVAGANRPGGFVSEEKTPYLAGKQCESCHGPGDKHIQNPGSVAERNKMKVSSKDHNVCLECHLCMETHRKVQF